jgi:hypothetical protein
MLGHFVESALGRSIIGSRGEMEIGLSYEGKQARVPRVMESCGIPRLYCSQKKRLR